MSNTPHLIHGRSPAGAFNVSIYAASREAAEDEFRFRYKAIGCFISADAPPQNGEGEESTRAFPSLPVLHVRAKVEKVKHRPPAKKAAPSASPDLPVVKVRKRG